MALQLEFHEHELIQLSNKNSFPSEVRSCQEEDIEIHIWSIDSNVAAHITLLDHSDHGGHVLTILYGLMILL